MRVVVRALSLSLCAFMMTIIVVPGLMASFLWPGGMSEDEVQFLQGIEGENAWAHLEHLTSLGERVTGTVKELEAQQYVYDCMMDFGLDEVEMESFATSSWEHHGTTMAVTSPTCEDIPITTFGGCYSVYGTEDGIPYSFGNEDHGKALTGQVVDVGTGTASQLEDAGDLEGAIVLVQRDDMVIPWPSITLYEIAHHGASAAMFYGYFGTYPDSDAIKQDAVGGPIPAFSISKDSSNRLKEMMDDGTVNIRIEGSADLYSVEMGQSVNVAGYLYGATYPDQYIVFSAHADTWWEGANDDTSGVAGVLELARHFSQSRDDGTYVNARTLVFCTFGSEEYGGPSDWYNWIVGSYEFVRAHPEIVDGLMVNLNLDMIGRMRTHGPYWLENTWEINDFLKDALADSKVHATWSYPLYSYTDSWSFASIGGGSAVYGSFVEGEYALYHTNLDILSAASPEPMKEMMDLYALMAIRMDTVLVMPFNFMTTITWMDGFLQAEALSVPSESDLFDGAGAALGILREQVMAANAYRHDLEMAFELAESNKERRQIAEAASEFNQALIEVRQSLNRLCIGQGGATGAGDVFLRPDQHVSDYVAVDDAVSALEMGSANAAMNALLSVHTMEWAPLCSPETYDYVMDIMYGDQTEMYWAGEFDQQQAYVDVFGIYLGLNDESLSKGEAQTLLEDILDGQLTPWLQEDVLMLEQVWTNAAARLLAVNA